MPSAIDEQMDANIDLLLKMHFDSNFDKTTFDTKVQEIKAQYEVAKKQAGKDAYAKDVADSIEELNLAVARLDLGRFRYAWHDGERSEG